MTHVNLMFISNIKGYNKKIHTMKKFQTYLLVFITVIAISCEKEPISIINNLPKEDAIPKGGELPELTLSLSFTVQTQQDQMGDFAENAMTIFNGKIWSIGGVNSYGISRSHFLWNSENGINWSTLPFTSTYESFTDFRVGHTLTVFNGKLYIIGGKDETDEGHTNIWQSSDGESWTESTAPFGSIPEHSTLILDNIMYLIAGNISTGNTEVWSTTNGIDWNIETPNAFSGRAGQKGVIFNNTMYIIGGEDIDGNKLNDIWSSTDGVNWTEITTSTVFTARNSNTATVHDDKVWVVGGETESGFVLDFWYSDNMVDWIEYHGPLPSTEGLFKHAALDYNGELWLFGGYQDEVPGIRRIGSIRSIEVR